MKKYDQLMGLVWFALGVGIVIEAIRLELGQLNHPGPGFIAFLVGVSLGLSGLILTLLATSKREEARKKIWAGLDWRNIALIILALLSYVVFLDYLGFLLITFLFILCLIKLTDPKKWLGAFIFSITVTFFCYLVFSFWLKITLPRGFLGIG